MIIEYWNSKSGEAIRIHKKIRMLLQQKSNLLQQSYPILIKVCYRAVLTSDYKASYKDTEKSQCEAPVLISVP